MFNMRILFALLLLLSVDQVWAQAPATVVAQTGWPNPHRITLLTESCGWPGGARRAQWIRADRSIHWGCWGYNETGVQIQWSSGQHLWIDYFELWYFDDRQWSQQLGYQRLHRRLAEMQGHR